jgi:CRISPR/Cas system-associated endonuclease/helicase Cas3
LAYKCNLYRYSVEKVDQTMWGKQRRAIDALYCGADIILNWPTGSGKTMVPLTYMLARTKVGLVQVESSCGPYHESAWFQPLNL